MPVLQFKGKTAIECYHHTVPHHFSRRIEDVFDGSETFFWKPTDQNSQTEDPAELARVLIEIKIDLFRNGL